jgi:hypothetical protein
MNESLVLLAPPRKYGRLWQVNRYPLSPCGATPWVAQGDDNSEDLIRDGLRNPPKHVVDVRPVSGAADLIEYQRKRPTLTDRQRYASNPDPLVIKGLFLGYIRPTTSDDTGSAKRQPFSRLSGRRFSALQDMVFAHPQTPGHNSSEAKALKQMAG